MGFAPRNPVKETPFSAAISRMNSSKRTHYSCSSSCPSSPSDSPLPLGDAAGLTVMGDRRQSFSERRRLTRSRKLRHATDDELGLGQLRRLCISRSTPVSPESTPNSRSPPCGADRWWSTAVPQPLPLPELASCRAAGSSAGHGNQGSPFLEGPNSELGGLYFSNCKTTRQTSAKPTDQPTTEAAKPTTYVRRGFSQNLNLDRQNLRCKAPARSAPSSPALSPPRSPPVFQGWPTLESGSLSPTPCRNFHRPKSPRSVTFPLHHHKSASDSPSTWHESNSNAHPLPLPPGPQLMSQPSPAYNKPNMSFSRGQWQKGKLIGRGTFGSVYVATNRARIRRRPWLNLRLFMEHCNS